VVGYISLDLIILNFFKLISFAHPSPFAEIHIPINSSLLGLVGKTSTGCRARNRTRTCFSESLPTNTHPSKLRRSLKATQDPNKAKPHPFKLRRTLKATQDPNKATPHPFKLRRTLKATQDPNKATPHPFKLRRALISCAASTQVRRTLLSYTAPY